MSNTNTGGWAFPAPAGCGEDNGMTLRDYFAAEAMKMHGAALMEADLGDTEEWDAFISVRAYATAEAMLKTRSKT